MPSGSLLSDKKSFKEEEAVNLVTRRKNSFFEESNQFFKVFSELEKGLPLSMLVLLKNYLRQFLLKIVHLVKYSSKVANTTELLRRKLLSVRVQPYQILRLRN